MNAIKQNLLWIVMGVILVGAGVLWFVQVAPINEKAGQLKLDLEGRRMDLRKLAKEPKKIPNDKFQRKASKFKRSVEAAQGEVRKAWESRQFTLDRARDFEPSPPATSIQFQEWLVNQYRKRNEKLTQSGCRIVDPALLGDHPHEVAVPKDEEQIVLKRLKITQNVFDVLAGARIEITVLEPYEDPENPGQTKERTKLQTRQIDELVKFQFIGEAEPGQRTRFQATERTFFDKWPLPYTAHAFQLTFRAHASIVPRVLQGFNEREAFVINPTRLRIVQIDQLKLVEDLGRGSDESRVEQLLLEGRKNDRYREAPVEVVVRGEALEFDFQKDRDFKPTDAAAAKTSGRGARGRGKRR